MSSVGQPLSYKGKQYVTLELNTKWISFARVKAPFELRNVSIQDMNNFLILSSYGQMPVSVADVDFDWNYYEPVNEITEDMRKGERPEEFRFSNETSDASTGSIVLVHGYCAASNPWSAYSSDWTNAYYFLSANSNDTNDSFAKKIAAFATAQGLKSYSAVGYSQGGMAISHLVNYYWSGLDNPKNGRVLQSVVTPYQGSSAAGTTASLGKLFGVGCGSVYDLTKDGASLWLSGVTTETRALVYYYYVTYDETQSAKYCNAATNLVLTKPNDGLTELIYAPLKGGVDCGKKSGWCHGNNMKYSPAFSDSTRNQEMNSKAARG